MTDFGHDSPHHPWKERYNLLGNNYLPVSPEGDHMSSSGRTPRESDEEILAVLRSAEDPVLSTAEVADQLTIERRSTLNRLRALEEQGLVESKQIGGRNTVWWLSASETADAAIPSDDPFFSEGALFGSDAPIDEGEIDDVVYGESEG